MFTRKQAWRRQKNNINMNFCCFICGSDNIIESEKEELFYNRKVKWNNCVNVVYIPDRTELQSFFLWYQKSDYVKFESDFKDHLEKDSTTMSEISNNKNLI